ncbi:MAG: protein-glutamate O-methyltransferase CheR [Bryobacteraceae bacterium]|nr:protein-glutamate O-methyltransferase CheR [Bryobacteraceae bacterium]
MEVTDEEFALFQKLIHEQSGIHLKETKRTLVASRLGKRLRQLGLSSLLDYYRLLKTSDPRGEELRRMINCITTNKTSFFREDQHFTFLRDALRARGSRAARIWSAACSSGEEPYSIAMTILEALGETAAREACILASDIDTDVLAAAARGIYEEEGIQGVDAALRRRYFLCGRRAYQGLVQVKPLLRRMVEFRQINLISGAWPVHGRFDAIFCRNVIIYFDRPTQERLFERLTRHLEPDGFLFVGHSESLFWLTRLVRPVGHTIYRLRAGSDTT